MSSFSKLSQGRSYELQNLRPNDANGIHRQVSDSIDSTPIAKAQSRVEVDNREGYAQSTNTEVPFLDCNYYLAVNTRHGSEIDSSGYLYNFWTWEIISILFSIVCMAAIIAVLLVYHSRPVPTLPSGLTLNALISLLATISRAAMLVSVASCISQLKWQWFRRPRELIYFNILDEASRGPWGSLELLLKTRRPSVVGLGALITIFAIGVDPFMQQIIWYPTKSVEAGSSSLARAQMYDTGFLPEESKATKYIHAERESHINYKSVWPSYIWYDHLARRESILPSREAISIVKQQLNKLLEIASKAGTVQPGVRNANIRIVLKPRSKVVDSNCCKDCLPCAWNAWTEQRLLIGL
jgi:hypothetical protein